MTLSGVVVGCYVAWFGWLLWKIDRPHVAAWVVRDWYRLSAWVSFALWLLLAWKASLWHAELLLVIRGCHG